MDVILSPNKRYTYADYLTWLDDKRRELLDGFIRLMSPAPSSVHAQVSLELAVLFKNFINTTTLAKVHEILIKITKLVILFKNY